MIEPHRGLQVSLDMEKAFDSIRGDIVLQALRTIDLPILYSL